MILNILLLVVGIAVVLWGADRFTDAASSIARRWNVSELVIGLTIVSMGTSLPEFVVSFFSSLQGSADMSVGNIVGSNIFNTLVIVGASAMMIPMVVTRGIIYRDILMTIGTAIAMWMLCTRDGRLDYHDGCVLLLVFCGYMGYAYYVGVHKPADQESSDQEVVVLSPLKTVFFIILGLCCLVGGGQVLVKNASQLAIYMGMSERLVGLTILAAGTSLPELATSVVAARKGSKGLALGNALGSNVFNICFVLGICPIINSMEVHDISNIDWSFLVGSGVILILLARTRMCLERWEGAVLLLAYFVYMSLLIYGV